MARKKKNLRNINTGDTVQFVNYLTPDHILRGKYNTGNNELDITDVPANLNSVITLGQGGGGGGDITPIVSIKVIKNDLAVYDINGFLNIKDNHLYISTLTSLEEDYTFDTVAWTEDGETFYVYFASVSDWETSMFPHTNTLSSVTECVNCTYDSDENALIITDPTQNASATVNLQHIE